MAVLTNSKKPRVSFDRSIERMREQLAELAPFLGKGKPTRSLDEFDFDAEQLIGDLLGQTSDLLHAYEYAELGEAAGLVNMTDEAPEGTGMDSQRQSLLATQPGVGELHLRIGSAPVCRTEEDQSGADPHRSAGGRTHVSGNPEPVPGRHSARGGAAHAEMENGLVAR